jgi:hypothetical protein
MLPHDPLDVRRSGRIVTKLSDALSGQNDDCLKEHPDQDLPQILGYAPEQALDLRAFLGDLLDCLVSGDRAVLRLPR